MKIITTFAVLLLLTACSWAWQYPEQYSEETEITEEPDEFSRNGAKSNVNMRPVGNGGSPLRIPGGNTGHPIRIPGGNTRLPIRRPGMTPTSPNMPPSTPNTCKTKDQLQRQRQLQLQQLSQALLQFQQLQQQIMLGPLQLLRQLQQQLQQQSPECSGLPLHSVNNQNQGSSPNSGGVNINLDLKVVKSGAADSKSDLVSSGSAEEDEAISNERSNLESTSNERQNGDNLFYTEEHSNQQLYGNIGEAESNSQVENSNNHLIAENLQNYQYGSSWDTDSSSDREYFERNLNDYSQQQSQPSPKSPYWYGSD